MDDGKMHCIMCQWELCWNNDFDASEVHGVPEDDGGIVRYYTCMRCGREYEIADPPREEREKTYRDYWNG